jgi:hypothetical protein
MTRVSHAWRALGPDQRFAVVAALALLVTMFFPWYGLQSVDRKTGAIYSHSINAFGDVSFVEAAVFLVAAGVCAMLFGRAEGREFRLPGGDGGIVMLAGAWATLLIFYRVFDRPSAPNHYPVGIEWGFVLAFAAAGGLAYAGWRMRLRERPEPPVRRRASASRPGSAGAPGERRPRRAEEEVTTIVPSPRRRPRPSGAVPRPAPVAADPRPSRPRYPPSPKPQQPQQLSFDEEP